MAWSTIDGKMHDENGSHHPDTSLTKMQLGKLLKKQAKEEAKRKREQQLAEARKIKRSKLASDVSEDINNNKTNNEKEPLPETQPEENQNGDPKDEVADGSQEGNKDEADKPLVDEADKPLVDEAEMPLVDNDSSGDKEEKKDNGDNSAANTDGESNGEDEGAKPDADRLAEETEGKKPVADSTQEPIPNGTPSPAKSKAGKVHRPRKFLPLSERPRPATSEEEEVADKEMDEDIDMQVRDDEDSTSTYSGSSTELDDDDDLLPKKKPAVKTKEDASVSTPTKLDVKPPAKQDDAKPPAKQNVKQSQAKPDRKEFDSNSAFLMAMFPNQVTHRKPEDSENPNKGTRATEKKRLVGQYPATERQQMDDKVRKQFALSLKHDCKLMPMMTPISRTDGFLETAAGRPDLDSIAQEIHWKRIIPIKGLYTEMMPNEGGSVAVKAHLKPKLGLLVPSQEVGAALFNIFDKAIKGEVQLQFFYEAFGEEGLMSMLLNKTGDKNKQPKVKKEPPAKKDPTITKGADGEEHAVL